jgi:sugar fermentation stimulation protein A
MLTDFIYEYPPLLSGQLIKRYKRFFADIELDSGEIITAHCPNTGPMTGVCTPKSQVWVSQSNNPKRKLAYTWETIRVELPNPTWVGVNTNLPNHVIKLALEKQLLPDLKGKYNKIFTEVVYGKDNKSRVDFLLTGEEHQLPIYLEVKNVTLAADTWALFPDTVTTRGQKHLRELTALLPHALPVMLYFINRSDCKRFSPADDCDRLYGDLLREAIALGVQVLPYRFDISSQGIKYIGKAEFFPSRSLR